MIPKIVLTQAGERIIAGVGELKNDEGVGICLILKCPYLLSMIPTPESADVAQYNVNFSKWIPYSSEVQFKVPYTSVVAIGDVEPNILEIYLSRFAEVLDDDDSVSTSDSSDNVEESAVSDIGD